MMRILVATALTPFGYGGAEILAEGLLQALANQGYDADLLALPFVPADPSLTTEHMLAARLIDLDRTPGQRPDAVIGLKFPAYLIRHPRKVVWLLHQHRAVYDLWDDEVLGWAAHPEGRLLQNAIVDADRCLHEAQAVFASSERIAERLRRFNGFDAPVVTPPVNDSALFESGPHDGPLLCPSRLDPSKRHLLVLQALALTRHPVQVQLVFPHANSDYAAQIRALVGSLGLKERVVWTGTVSRPQLRMLYATCRGVIFTPVDEDYGFVTVEAMLAGRPVVTCTDSGGARALVEDGVNGWIVAPEPHALAAALDELWAHPELARRRGETGRSHVGPSGQNWPATVRRLLSPILDASTVADSQVETMR